MEEVKEYSLTNDDIQRILDPDTNILTYPQFNSMNDIDECFDSLGRCVFLFLTTSPSSGHWSCMFKRNNNTIEYFDSYGGKPEAPRSWLTKDQLEGLGQSERSLWNLLKKSGYKVYYNTFPYQKNRDDLNTCGRWCVARLICKDLSNLQFYNVVKNGMKEKGFKGTDDWVADFTHDILGK